MTLHLLTIKWALSLEQVTLDLSDITLALGAIVLLEDGLTYDTITFINYNTDIISFVVDDIKIVGQMSGVLPPPSPMTCDEAFLNFFITSTLIVYEENLNPVFHVRMQRAL